MFHKLKLLLISISFLLFASCGGIYYSKKDSDILSRGVYATQSSLVVSRVDLASKYINETARIVTPPKNPIKVLPLERKTKNAQGVETSERIVVLPENAPANTIRVNSTEFQELLKDKQTLANYVKGEESWKGYSNSVETQLRKDAENNLKKDKVIVSQEKQIKSLIWYRNIVWGVIGGIGLIIALYVFSLLVRAGIAGAKVVS
jgi:hypothetical protein